MNDQSKSSAVATLVVIGLFLYMGSCALGFGAPAKDDPSCVAQLASMAGKMSREDWRIAQAFCRQQGLK